jgi:hypothetical protein
MQVRLAGQVVVRCRCRVELAAGGAVVVCWVSQVLRVLEVMKQLVRVGSMRQEVTALSSVYI